MVSEIVNMMVRVKAMETMQANRGLDSDQIKIWRDRITNRIDGVRHGSIIIYLEGISLRDSATEQAGEKVTFFPIEEMQTF
jgi:hypothetical protein